MFKKVGQGPILIQGPKALLAPDKERFDAIFSLYTDSVDGDAPRRWQFTWGAAQISLEELEILKKKRKEFGKGGRSEFLEWLYEQGYPVPEDITASGVAQFAGDHACVVAGHLLEKRGPEGYPLTVISYMFKNAGYRLIIHYLKNITAPDIKNELWTDLFNPYNRDLTYKNPAVEYPPGVDHTKIYGVGMLHFYWPANLMRTVEALRLHSNNKPRLSNVDLEKLGATNLSEDEHAKYNVNWQGEWLQQAFAKDKIKDKFDIPVNIALAYIEQLQARGLSNKQIARLIVYAYSPVGVLWEHGWVPETFKIWERLLGQIALLKGNAVKPADKSRCASRKRMRVLMNRAVRRLAILVPRFKLLAKIQPQTSLSQELEIALLDDNLIARIPAQFRERYKDTMTRLLSEVEGT